MTVKIYSRLELARNQLIGAIYLYTRGGDKFSAISLAGAADVILSQLVISRGAENFTEYLIKMETARGEEPSTREVHGKAVNDQLHINDLKHLDDGDDEYVEIDDLDVTALAAILKALANYNTLSGPRDNLVLGFRAWIKKNLDPAKYNVDSDPNWKSSEDRTDRLSTEDGREDYDGKYRTL